MKQVVIENPVINSPFEEPTRHFRFTDEGITNEKVELRRKSAYFIPIAAPKKKSKQALAGEPKLPAELQGTLHSLYGNYEKYYRMWEKNTEARDRGLTPQFFS